MTDHQESRASNHGHSTAEALNIRPDGASVPQNLLDVKRSIQRMVLRPERLRADIISALHTIARGAFLQDVRKPSQEQIDAALVRIGVNARFLTPLFDRRIGARLGYTRATWRNIPWRVRKALKLTGAWHLFKTDRIPLSEEWLNVARRVPEVSPLRLLGHWAMVSGIQPMAFSEAHLPQFLDWLQTWKTRQYALKTYFAALGAWNKGARQQSDWPGRPVHVETRLSGHYSVPQEKWSQELVHDVARVIDVLHHPDPDEEQPFEPIREGTAKTYRERLLRTMSAFVAARQIEPSSIKSVRELLAPDAAKSALDFMLRWTQRRKPTVQRTSDVHGSAKLLATIAERCYQPPLPAETILRLQKMARARAPIRKGMTPKNRELLRLFDNEELLARFLAMPYEVIADVLKRTELRRVDEVRFMLAFAVAQLIEAPLRPEDQASLIDGEHVFTVKSGRTTTLAIRLVAQKNNVDLDFELSAQLAEIYVTYMTIGRKKLCAGSNRYVYPGPGDGPKCRGSLSPQITRFVEDELGIRMTCQQFRHVIGYVYLKSHPGDYETVRQLLGHTDITTTMAFYASMDMREASKKVSAFVTQRRRELAPLLRKRGQSKQQP